MSERTQLSVDALDTSQNASVAHQGQRHMTHVNAWLLTHDCINRQRIKIKHEQGYKHPKKTNSLRAFLVILIQKHQEILCKLAQGPGQIDGDHKSPTITHCQQMRQSKARHFSPHMGWLSLDDWEDEFLPTPGAAIPQPAVLQPNKRHRPSMLTIPEEPGRSSSSASGLPGGGSGASGLPAEGRNANNEQCLQMLGSYLERKKRFDNRGYRSQIRRQLRRLLDDNDIHYPDWLDDHTQPVNEWRDRAFKEIQSIKKTGKLTLKQVLVLGRQVLYLSVLHLSVVVPVACLQKAQACLQSGRYSNK